MGVWPLHGQHRRGLYSLHNGPELIADESAPHYHFLVSGLWRFRDIYIQWIGPVLAAADIICFRLANFVIPAEPEWGYRRINIDEMLAAFSCHLASLESALRAIDFGHHWAWAAGLALTEKQKQAPIPLELDIINPLLVLRDYQIPAAELLLNSLAREVLWCHESNTSYCGAGGGRVMPEVCWCQCGSGQARVDFNEQAKYESFDMAEFDGDCSSNEVGSNQPTNISTTNFEIPGSLKSEPLEVTSIRSVDTPAEPVDEGFDMIAGEMPNIASGDVPTENVRFDFSDSQSSASSPMTMQLPECPVSANHINLKLICPSSGIAGQVADSFDGESDAWRDSALPADDYGNSKTTEAAALDDLECLDEDWAWICEWSIEETCRALRVLFPNFDDGGVRSNHVNGRALLDIIGDPARVILATIPVHEVSKYAPLIPFVPITVPVPVNCLSLTLVVQLPNI